MRPGWVSTKLWRESSTWINSTCLILISYWTEVQSIWGIQTVSQIPPQQSLRYPTQLRKRLMIKSAFTWRASARDLEAALFR